MKTIVIIPSRLSATRLPNKPLLKINDVSIISHVFKRAEEANIGEVIVATEDQEIIDDVKKNGGNAILTSRNHKTGTDRIFEAFSLLNLKNVDFIMNIQGDEPQIDMKDIINLNNKMTINQSKIGTLAAKISKIDIFKNEHVVKVKINQSFEKESFPEAELFTRKTNDKKNIFHHIGIYCYEKDTLKNFVSLKQSQNEIKNKLEQLRALDNGIKINVAHAQSSPIGVDTKEDFLALKKIMEYKSK